MLYDTLQVKDKTVKIYYDECGDSPREWDNLGTMTCWHKRYNLGDKHNHETWQCWLLDLISDKISYDELIAGWRWDELLEYAYYNNIPNPDCTGSYPLNKINDIVDKYYIMLPIYTYEHGGIALSTTKHGQFADRWDSGQSGYIYVSKEDVKSEYGWKYLTKERIEKIESYLRSEVEIYNLYVMGRTYGFISTCNRCNEEDSCWGFYGEDWKENGLLEANDYFCQCHERTYNQLVVIQE